jgi:predicted outer membrane repeat protein
MLQEILLLPLDEQLLSVAFLWSCWTERNRENHGENRRTIEQFQFNVRSNWKQFLKKDKSTKVLGTSTCTAPPFDWVKINTDASFSENTKSGGWGAIYCDDTPDIQFVQLDVWR